VKLVVAKAAAALGQPDPAIRFYLLSGGDSSSSRLHAQRLLAGLGAEKVMLAASDLRSDPSRLADEAASLSMFGGRRLLWIEPAGEEIVPAVTALLEAPAIEAPAVAIISSALKKDSNLKKLCEAHPHALHLASEALAPREQVAQVMELGRLEGLRIEPALAERVASEAGGDLLLARLELQKFALHLDAAPDRPKPLGEEVVDALGIDQAETDHNRVGDLALSGDLSGLASELGLLAASGIDPIPVVRALQRRLLMLAPLRARVEQGQRPDSVLSSVWQRDKAVVARILPRWNATRLADALGRVRKLERELLLQPVPSTAALGETLLQIARAARG
jgi:DNA polymerase III subunit delta